MDFLTKENLAIPKPAIKILVVDDREDNLFSIETILEPDGYTIKTANSGRAALKILLKEYDFTLILMDVQMPELNGFETATLIYERDKLRHIPIIFVTANDRGDDNMFRGYQMGGVDYIYKPINPELLRVKVAVFVELYNKNHQLLAQEQKLITANRNLEKEIQERRNSEEQVIELNTQLMEKINQLKLTNEELERFAYVASHDLQEPLRKIIIFGDRLSANYKNVLGKDGNDFLDRMLKASERMQLLIKNLLSFSRSTTNEDASQEVNLNHIIENVLSDLEIQIEQKNAIYNIQELPVVWGIASQFRQLFQNLIINALKFSKKNTPPELEVFCEMVDGSLVVSKFPDVITEAEEKYYQIHVKDNGIGFDQKYADQIFTVFKRLHGFDEYEGTGIGLSICKKIVEKHAGCISVVSKKDEGSTFTITLPVKKHSTVTEVVA